MDKIVDDSYIEKARGDPLIIRLVKDKDKYFKRLPVKNAKKLITLILNKNDGTGTLIPVTKIKDENISGFRRYNMGKIENDFIKPEVVSKLRDEIIQIMNAGGELDSDTEQTELKFDESEKGYPIDKTISYMKLIESIGRIGTDAIFKYNFDTADLPLISVPANTPELQRCKVTITTPGVQFDFPISYSYICPECNKGLDTIKFIQRRSALEVSSVSAITCGQERVITKDDGDAKIVKCQERLKPARVEGDSIEAYYYQTIMFKNEATDETIVSSAVSFNNYPPGQYECVIYKTFQPLGRGQYHIVDGRMKQNKKAFILPTKVDGENYIITLQKAIDTYIEEETGMRIWGLLPIKAALILQAALSGFNWDLVGNLYLIGQRATGKSLVLKYWSPMLYGWYAYSSTGVSISVPSLRGTEVKLNLLGKDISDLSVGYLGIFKSITIDEAGQNEELVKDLKSFIFEMEYSFDKKGGKGVRYQRKAHLNLTSNLNIKFKTEYIKGVKQTYKDLPDEANPENTDVQLPKPPWDECWDLYLPLAETGEKYRIRTDNDYPNFYLIKAIDKKRTELMAEDKWWVDGLDLAVHDRFPLYFYLTSEKTNAMLREIVSKNTSRSPLRTNMEIVNALDSETIQNYIKDCKKFENSEEDIKAFLKVDDILDEMDIEGAGYTVRLEGFYQMLVRASRMLNQRMNYIDDDFSLLRWILSTTNKKIDIDDLASYSIPTIIPKEAPICKIDVEKKLTPGQAFAEDSELVKSDIPLGAWKR
jgi:hypothetical protein